MIRLQGLHIQPYQAFASSPLRMWMVEWMEEKGYTLEATHLRVVRGWRRACDERGLSDTQRHRYNMDFLNYILDELMPWHKEPALRDFSLLEVNRYVRLATVC